VPNPSSPLQSDLKSALTLFERRQPEQAMQVVDRALAAAISNDELRGVAFLLLRFGRTADALAAFERMLVNDPRSAVAHSNIAQLKSEHDAAEVDAMLALAKTTNEDTSSGIQLNFALGKAFADLGEFDRSFEYYARANAARRKGLQFSVPGFQTLLRHTRMAFQEPLFDRLAGAGVNTFRPIFIVGMPRSGSTLVEQVLASHPQVYGGDELSVTAEVTEAAQRKHFSPSVPGLVNSATPAMINELARSYIRAVRPLMGKKPRLTDKCLTNFWNIGLLKLMFPEARFIHCVRDPLDNAVSIYRSNFADPGPNFAYDLSEIGAYFKQHDSLMRHWDEVLPGVVMHVRYEHVVDQFEPMARKLVAFCDLTWDDRCLSFHRTERAVKTASVAQVRKPIYRDAVGSAQPYMAHLAPLIEALR